jgi:hypothetical protein
VWFAPSQPLQQTVGQLFGSLKNVAQRRLDSMRLTAWEAEGFDAGAAGKLRRGLDTS